MFLYSYILSIGERDSSAKGQLGLPKFLCYTRCYTPLSPAVEVGTYLCYTHAEVWFF